MQILIAPDSFKDCMGALSVAEALERGIRKVMPDTSFVKIPMADGGEGTVESIIDATGGKIIRVPVMDPLLREITSFYGISGDGTTAVIEMAAASGLELLKFDERNPWITTTYGTGQLILHALGQGCATILLGIGGSATNDGGMGMASALGVKFLDAGGSSPGPGGGEVGKVKKIIMDGLDPRISQSSIQVACDVSNPLTGPDGASHVYGPQKGADSGMVESLDRNLVHFAGKIVEQLGENIDRVPGAGAAGGLGAGLMAFLGAKLVKGFEMVADSVDLEGAILKSDLVITGEGRLDGQTRFGKTPFGVAQMSKKHGIPVIGIAGSVEEEARGLLDLGFDVIMPIQEKPVELSWAIENAEGLIERAGERIARLISLKL